MNRSSIDRSRIYRITLRGRLDDSWADWFGGMTVRSLKDEDGVSVTHLTGAVTDQAALHGLLGRVRDLGLTLLRVECLEPAGGPDSSPIHWP
jgi:hypothetical protein